MTEPPEDWWGKTWPIGEFVFALFLLSVPPEADPFGAFWWPSVYRGLS
jgi:hypothetical protein